MTVPRRPLRAIPPLVAVLASAITVLASATAGARGVARVVAVPPVDARFSYQIGGAFPPPPGTGIVDRDWHDTPAPGIFSICYVNAFQAQPEDVGSWKASHPSLLLRRAGRLVVDQDWNEPLLDTSTAAKRRGLAAIVGSWIDRCARKGFRGVEPDNLDSWTRSHGLLTETDNLAYAQLLIARAHRDGLSIAQKNASELGAVGRHLGFDFAIAEECQPYNECTGYLGAYGNHVIEIEYPDNGGAANFALACRLRGGTISIVYRDRNVTPAGHPGFLEQHCA